MGLVAFQQPTHVTAARDWQANEAKGAVSRREQTHVTAARDWAA